MLIPRRQLTLAALLMPFAAVVGCGKKSTQNSGSAQPTKPHQIKKSDMSAAEQKYGMAPVPDASVEYQPDVIVVGGGAESVREQHGNGFMWSIDAGAARADELVPGKIMFLTNRAVGRVLGTRKEGDNLVLVLGPVEINELIRNADIRIDSMPIDFGEALAYAAPDMPGQAISLAQNVPHSPSALNAMFVPTANSPNTDASADIASEDVSKLLKFKIAPNKISTGLGMRATCDADGLKVDIKLLLHLATPKLTAILKIKDGGIQEVSLVLSGAAGLTWNFDAGTDVGRSANVNGILTPNVDFSIPIGALGGAPLALTVRQRLQINTQLNVRYSTLAAKGQYTFNGGFGVTYRDKKWDVVRPVEFKQVASFAQTGEGVSLGVIGINLGHSTRVVTGIGAWGFVAGPYVTFYSAVGLTKTSDVGLLHCYRAPVVLKMNGGIGYLLPQTVTNAINSFLRFFKIRYQLRGEGGLEPSQPLILFDTDSRTGGCSPPSST